MLCQDCVERDKCERVCSALEADLSKICVGNREDLFFSERVEISEVMWGDDFSEDGIDSLIELLDLYSMLLRLNRLERLVIEGYFWEGKSFYLLAKELGCSRTQVFRLLKQGIKNLRRLVRDKLRSKKFLSFREKLGYNKKGKKWGKRNARSKSQREIRRAR